MRIDRYSIRVALVLCSALPFLFFWHTPWVPAALLGYGLTAIFFCIALLDAYPPFGTSWFWKAMVLILIIHSTIIFGLVWLDLKVPYANRWPRALYGFGAMLMAVEWRLSLYIIDNFEPPSH
jgi:hypothetical protein